MNRLGAILSRPLVVALATAAIVVFGVFFLPAMSAIMGGNAPEGGAFDTELYYTPLEALHKASLYGPAARLASIRVHRTYDLAFPLAYGCFAASAWALGLRLLAREGRAPRYALLAIPVLGPLFDLCENAAVSALLAADPSAPPAKALAVAASVATLCKFVLVIPAFAGAACLPLAGAVAAFRRRARPPA